MTTPSEPPRPHDGPPLEPIRVLRPRRTDALAELFRQFEEDQADYEQVSPPRAPAGAEDETQELPPLAPARSRRRASLAERPSVVLTAMGVAAVLGFGGAALLTGPGPDDRTAPAAPRPSVTSAAAPLPPPPTPDYRGFLSEGDAGPEVTELQQRLLRVPDVYRDGSIDGRYDATLTAAVARFQLWYGIQGDETGVYGDDTRRALESRT
ncbi:peptidoglycan-binding protein [Streptomyces sp. 15-116A]|uniref:peptidoglycan-binding domain-containing protein n=1 Tax=Streptomyces sp. 15-116A TaxID=2259035 RepID=UPI0021B30941|nr:peptidoglycan-binding domain-containing protein [Streptomyces sp. 15-116A]MCT7353485.1 peptidoglycan-binding protein [Streptomyces sp. 15-116A]